MSGVKGTPLFALRLSYFVPFVPAREAASSPRSGEGGFRGGFQNCGDVAARARFADSAGCLQLWCVLHHVVA